MARGKCSIVWNHASAWFISQREARRNVFKFVGVFFNFIGTQNDYNTQLHWYKTRFGFKTSWELAKILTTKQQRND